MKLSGREKGLVLTLDKLTMIDYSIVTGSLSSSHDPGKLKCLDTPVFNFEQTCISIRLSLGPGTKLRGSPDLASAHDLLGRVQEACSP